MRKNWQRRMSRKMGLGRIWSPVKRKFPDRGKELRKGER
jgi:hypothetical protein